MTLPGMSAIKSAVTCGMDSATAKEDPVAINMTYLKLVPELEEPRNVLKILLSGLFWLAKRSRVEDLAIVIGQGLRERLQFLPLE